MARPVDHAPELASARARAVLEQLRDESRTDRWMSMAARRLGVHRSTILRTIDGSRPVTNALVERIGKALDLPDSYFTDERLGRNPPHQAYRRPPSDVRDEARGIVEAIDHASHVLDAVMRKVDAEPAARGMVRALDMVPLLPAYREAVELLEKRKPMGNAALRLALALREIGRWMNHEPSRTAINEALHRNKRGGRGVD